MSIRIFVTGGTFDKEYNELNGSLYFKDTHLPEMLRLGRSRVDVSVRTLMMIDSLEMTDADRALIVEQCRQATESRLIITHGTDTMVETAAALAGGAAPGVGQDDRPHRRDDPLRVRQFRRPVQPRERAVVRAGAAAGRLHRDERSLFPVGPRQEEPRKRRL